MNLNTAPIRQKPIIISIMPAMMVAIVSPVIPYWAIMPEITTMKAPVGPPIRKREPPNTAMMKPATIAVMRPCWGVTPDAMPKAIARGSAMIPTMMPAIRSETNLSLL